MVLNTYIEDGRRRLQLLEEVSPSPPTPETKSREIASSPARCCTCAMTMTAATSLAEGQRSWIHYRGRHAI